MRDKREKDWFWLENDIVDRTDISIYEKMLYVCLARHSYGKDYSFPGLDTLCNELGIKDKRTVVKYAKTLEEKGFITIEKRKGKANKYYLNNIKKVGTSHVGTSDVGSNISCSEVGTSDAQSSNIPCTSNKKRIININKKTTTTNLLDTKLDTPTNTDTETLKDSGGSLDSRKQEIRAIKQKLQESNLELLTCKNIMKIVTEKQLTLERLKTVIDFSLSNNKSPGFIVAALKNDYELTIKPKNNLSKRSKSIDEDILKTKLKREKDEKAKMEFLQEKEILDTYFDSLPEEKQNELMHTACEIAKKEYGFVWETMAKTKVKYDLIKKFKEVI